MANVVDNPQLHRFELTEEGHTAIAEYRRHDERLSIVHVEAPKELQGHGTASRLMEGIVAMARANKWTISPRCPYADAWFKRHPEAHDLLSA
jgi:predicted GNAT family acetyltransferase